MKSHPASFAWQKWVISPEGQECVFGRAEGQYLQNRLERAFQAAWKAASDRLEEPYEVK